MKNRRTFYIKLFLSSLFFIFVIFFCAVNTVERLDDIHVREPNEIIIGDDSLSNDGGFIVESENKRWQIATALNLFNNKKFDNNKIISPGSKGDYEFVVKNNTLRKITYVIGFGEDYDFFVNMKYKLKKDGKYVVGDEKNWVSVSELMLSENIIESSEKNRYLLEWYWDSDEKDTVAGINGGYYTLKLMINIE